MHHSHDLTSSALEAKYASCDENCAAAEAVGPSTCADPSSIHTLEEPSSKSHYLFKFGAKVQRAAEAADEKAGVYLRHFKTALVHEFEESLTKLIHVDLDGVRKVNQQVGRALVLAARSVQTDCGNFYHSAPLHKEILVCQVIEALASFDQVLRKAHFYADFRNFVMRLCKPVLFRFEAAGTYREKI